MRHSAVCFGERTVTKTGPPEAMRVEVEKTRRAHEIGASCGWFRVPEVLDYDDTRGVAVFERLAITPMTKAFPWGREKTRLARAVGISLATIHRELVLPSEARVPLPPELALAEDEVYLHGDLSTENVCVGSGTSELVIVDWHMTRLYGGRATYGTRYFDIIWFIHNLLNRPRTRFLFGNPVASMVRDFLDAYAGEAGDRFHADVLAAYAHRFFDLEMPRFRAQLRSTSRGRARLMESRNEAMLRAFLQSIPSYRPRRIEVFEP